MQIKGLLFDLDGTLINTSELIIKTFEATIINSLNRKPSREEITKSFGLPLAECLKSFDEEKVPEMLKFYREYNSKYHDELIKPFPQVSNVLSLLAASDIKMAVVTSKKSPMALRGLDIFDLSKYITAIIGCDECHNHKPHPEPMEKGAQALGLEPQECLCVGDSPFDIQSGKAAGSLTAAVKWTYCEWSYLLDNSNPDYILNTMPDLLSIISEKNKLQ